MYDTTRNTQRWASTNTFFDVHFFLILLDLIRDNMSYTVSEAVPGNDINTFPLMAFVISMVKLFQLLLLWSSCAFVFF